MRILTSLAILVFGAVLSAPVSASNVDTYPEDPYSSSGRWEHIRTLAVDVDKAIKMLEPVKPLPDSADSEDSVLEIHNPTFTIVYLYLNGLRIGDIEALDTAVLRDLKPGWYEVVMVRPNGFRAAYEMATVPSLEPKPIIPAPEVSSPPERIRQATPTSKIPAEQTADE